MTGFPARDSAEGRKREPDMDSTLKLAKLVFNLGAAAALFWIARDAQATVLHTNSNLALYLDVLYGCQLAVLWITGHALFLELGPRGQLFWLVLPVEWLCLGLMVFFPQIVDFVWHHSGRATSDYTLAKVLFFALVAVPLLPMFALNNLAKWSGRKPAKVNRPHPR